LLALQVRLAVPLLLSAYCWLDGLNGPARNPLDAKLLVGETKSTPVGAAFSTGELQNPRIRLIHTISHIELLALIRRFSYPAE
jgi:hypothetical protein